METAHNIDPATNLIGVSAVPPGSCDGGRPGVILINAGFLHRVGPNRMNVTIARKLAAAGFASLRMDLSGLGDSMSGSAAAQDHEIVAEDLDRAMAFMRDAFGLDAFVLVGLCSGAYDTARKAIADERVVGLVNIDGTGYRTRRFYVNHVLVHLLRRVAHPSRWRRLWRRYRDNARLRAAGGTPARPVLMNSVAYTDWTLEESGTRFEALAARGVRMHFVYTGGVSGFYNYRSQFRDIFRDYDFGDMASSSYFPATDHLTMLEHHRREVHDDIVGWVRDSFARAG